MCVEDGRRPEPPPEKENTMKKSQKQATETLVEHNGAEPAAKHAAAPIGKPEATSKKGKVVIKRKAAVENLSKERSKSKIDNSKLVCRYCGSDDLAPSFIKRRDARCRACFKQRYGSAKRGQEGRKVA